jgi:hypothetical protein
MLSVISKISIITRTNIYYIGKEGTPNAHCTKKVVIVKEQRGPYYDSVKTITKSYKPVISVGENAITILPKFILINSSEMIWRDDDFFEGFEKEDIFYKVPIPEGKNAKDILKDMGF